MVRTEPKPCAVPMPRRLPAGYGVGVSAAAISTEELTKFYVGVAGLRRRDLSR